MLPSSTRHLCIIDAQFVDLNESTGTRCTYHLRARPRLQPSVHFLTSTRVCLHPRPSNTHAYILIITIPSSFLCIRRRYRRIISSTSLLWPSQRPTTVHGRTASSGRSLPEEPSAHLSTLLREFRLSRHLGRGPHRPGCSGWSE